MKKLNVVLKKALALFLNLIVLSSLLCACKTDRAQDNGATENSTDIYDVTDDVAIPQWKTAYLDFLETVKDYHLSYALVYIDNDDIPELYLSGDCEATGDSICSYKNGDLVEQQLNRIGGGQYVERSGALINQNGNMGYMTTRVYKLDGDTFKLTFEALSIERVEILENDEYRVNYEYSVWDKAATEIEYKAAVEAAFDFENAVRLNKNSVEYDIIQQQIINHG